MDRIPDNSPELESGEHTDETSTLDSIFDSIEVSEDLTCGAATDVC